MSDKIVDQNSIDMDANEEMTLEKVAVSVESLARICQTQFVAIEERFVAVDKRFEQMDEKFTDLKASMMAEFRKINYRPEIDDHEKRLLKLEQAVL